MVHGSRFRGLWSNHVLPPQVQAVFICKARSVSENHILLRLMENPQMQGFRNPEE